MSELPVMPKSVVQDGLRLPVNNHDPIEDWLRAQVDAASQRHESAKREFWVVAARSPHRAGAPASPEDPVLEKAVRAQNAAREELIAALKRFNDYLLYGAVPEQARAQLDTQAFHATR